MTRMQTNEERAAGYRELQAEFEAAGKTVLAEKAAKRAAEFEAMPVQHPIGTPVIYNGKFATVVGRDNGTEEAIIECCDGAYRTARDADLTIDQDSVDDFNKGT